MKIAISGSTGLVGKILRRALSEQGHSVTFVVRPMTLLTSNQKVIRWDPESGRIEKEALEGYDCIIHLSGVNIAGGRWTEKYKQEILKSRTKGTTLLASAIAQLKKPPRLFFCASAVGYYGISEFSDVKNEASPKGEGFLADVCEAWERAAEPARRAGVRTVHARFGMVLDKTGGALAKMLPAFKLGLGGRLGEGKQPMSWIACAEIPHAVVHVIEHEEISGAVNFTAPQCIDNAEFTRGLAKAIRRPAVFPVPAFGLNILFGEMADSLLLGGQNVTPQKLLQSGYQFKYPVLESALNRIFS